MYDDITSFQEITATQQIHKITGFNFNSTGVVSGGICESFKLKNLKNLEELGIK